MTEHRVLQESREPLGMLTGSGPIIDRMVICQHGPLCPVVEDKPRDSLFEIVCKLRQEGGTARTIDWQVVKLA